VERNKVLSSYFLPDSIVEMPVPTIVRIFDIANANDLLKDYSIYFMTNLDLPDNIYSDIKWEENGDVKNTKKIKFFKSLLFLLLLEISHPKNRVKEVEFLFSYPKAFSKDDIDQFKASWSHALHELVEKSDLDNKIINIIDTNLSTTECLAITNYASNYDPQIQTEGIAAGEFFANPEIMGGRGFAAPISAGAICLDIGGGTTDISIWNDGKVIFDASILLAGRQISQIIQKNIKLRQIVFSDEAVKALEEVKNNQTAFATRLNFVLKNEEVKICSLLPLNAGNSDLQWFRKLLALEFGSIVYFTGISCFAADIGKDYSMGEGILYRANDAGLSFHWGGNAAKFISWIDNGKFSVDGFASKIFYALFMVCLNDIKKELKAKTVKQSLSPHFKSEASGGLVVMDHAKYKKRESEDDINSFNEMDDLLSTLNDQGNSSNNLNTSKTGILAGEDIELYKSERFVNNTVVSTDLLTEDDLYTDNKLNLKSISLNKLIRFIDVFNLIGLKQGLFKEDNRIKLTENYKQVVKDDVRKHFADQAHKEKGKRQLEPIFIVEVRILIELLRAEFK